MSTSHSDEDVEIQINLFVIKIEEGDLSRMTDMNNPAL